ncbi:MAG TPA: RHS repeat-associated core domain-containing protein, partial [Chloroflexota bacterium]|nr:RHS repeat-associated core domain-containing protein [Chloroflexota bacterium]
ISDASGFEVAWARYDPFGQLRLSGGVFPTDRLFTGQIRDLNDDRLYFYQSRHYDASVGRFLQADTATPNGKNPQAINPFANALSVL